MPSTANIKLLVFLAVWKRPEITEICFMGLKRLQKVSGFDIQLFAVISEESMIPLCEKYGVDWCFHENLPLGRKKNFGLAQAMRKDFEYLVEIGSDDILKDEFLDIYPWDRDVMALFDFVHLNTEDGECRRITKHYAYYGAGRAISRSALDKIGSPWSDDLNRGLDMKFLQMMNKNKIVEKRYQGYEPVLVGLKSELNIWPYQRVGVDYSLQAALKGLSEEEVNAIKCLVQKNTLVGSTVE
jgi:hypothetical protein